MPYDTHIQLGGKDELHADNDRHHPDRAVDSTQVKTADRGLGVHAIVTSLVFFRTIWLTAVRLRLEHIGPRRIQRPFALFRARSDRSCSLWSLF